jgi:hypothetical protein
VDTLEGSAPTEMGEEPTSAVNVRRAGNVGAPATSEKECVCERERERERAREN